MTSLLTISLPFWMLGRVERKISFKDRLLVLRYHFHE